MGTEVTEAQEALVADGASAAIAGPSALLALGQAAENADLERCFPVETTQEDGDG